MKRLVSTLDMDKDTWLQYRNMGIGGSDTAAILGLSKYKQPLRIYMEKTGQWQQEDISHLDSVYWGITLEPVVAEEFAKRNPEFTVKKCNYILQHPEHSFMLANVDRLLQHSELGQGVLEIKTANSRMDHAFTDDSIPIEYALQIQHYLAVLNLSYGYVAVLIGGSKYKQYFIERDDELIAMLIEKESNFWNNHVLATHPPMPDVEVDCRDIFEKLYPIDSLAAQELDLTDFETNLIVDSILENKEQIKVLEHEIEVAENILKAKMQEHESALVHNYKISWKYSKTSYTVDAAKLRTEHPEIYEQVKKEKKPSRIFRIAKGSL